MGVIGLSYVCAWPMGWWSACPVCVCGLHRGGLCGFVCVGILHGGGLPSPIVAQEGGDLALVEAETQAVHGGRGPRTEPLHQVSNTHPLHQAVWLGLEEGLAWDKHTKM